MELRNQQEYVTLYTEHMLEHLLRYIRILGKFLLKLFECLGTEEAAMSNLSYKKCQAPKFYEIRTRHTQNKLADIHRVLCRAQCILEGHKPHNFEDNHCKRRRQRFSHIRLCLFLDWSRIY
jgi:hypothetical protein